MLAISARPHRYSHDLIDALGEFVVNIPTKDQKLFTDYAGVTTGRDEDKWQARGLTPIPATMVKPPLIEECPINLECRVVETVRLPSHSLFIGEVVALHVVETWLNERDEINLSEFDFLRYGGSVVRERPVKKVNVDQLRRDVR